MNTAAPAILDHLASLSDATRSRMLLLLERHELTVSELCSVMQLPQSTVSRHLKALSESGWITSRAEGTSRWYRATGPAIPGSDSSRGRDRLDPSARRLWLLVRDQVETTSAAAGDQRRLQGALGERRTKSQEFFSSAAGHWDRLRDELFGNAFHMAALVGLVDRDWVVGDLGCGTGQVSAAVAPFVDRVVAVDSSAAMLRAARKRLHGFDNVDLRRGDLEGLPIDDERLDAATLMLALHHVPEPGKAMREIARVLRPGGRVLVVDMLPHDREWYRQQMGHVWLGFAEDQTLHLLEAAGFERIAIVPLPTDAKAKGPGLFAATGRKRPHGSAPARDRKD